MALLAFSGPRTKLIAAVEGLTSAVQLEAVLQQAVGQHEGHLAMEQADANERVCCLSFPWLYLVPHVAIAQQSDYLPPEDSLGSHQSHISGKRHISDQLTCLKHAENQSDGLSG